MCVAYAWCVRLTARQLSSGSLLAGIRQRKTEPAEDADARALLRDMCDFMRREGGTATSDACACVPVDPFVMELQHILAEFADRVPATKATLFKSLLKEIATLAKERRRGASVGIWTLKPDYTARSS